MSEEQINIAFEGELKGAYDTGLIEGKKLGIELGVVMGMDRSCYERTMEPRKPTMTEHEKRKMTKERKKQIVASTCTIREEKIEERGGMSEAEDILSDLATDWWRDKINTADVGASVPMGDCLTEYCEKNTDEGYG